MRARKKPVEIEFFKYDGDFKYQDGKYCIPDWAVEAFDNDVLYYGYGQDEPWELSVKTHQGYVNVNVGDYVIKALDGELYPCNPKTFLETYDIIPEANAENPVTVRRFPGATIIPDESRVMTLNDYLNITGIEVSGEIDKIKDKIYGKALEDLYKEMDESFERIKNTVGNDELTFTKETLEELIEKAKRC